MQRPYARVTIWVLCRCIWLAIDLTEPSHTKNKFFEEKNRLGSCNLVFHFKI